MNHDEEIARRYLSRFGYKQIVYEPDGNQPPDFILDNTVACEVRRLNQFYQNGKSNEPLENLEYPLYHKLKNIFSSFNDDSLPNSAFVAYTIRRPFKLDKKTTRGIKDVCSKHMQHIDSIKEYTVGQNLTLRFIPSDKLEDQVYYFGSSLDFDKGGFVVNETIKSLNIVIAEKEKKVLPFFHKYDNWWLILINHIFADIDRIENEEIQKNINISSVFSQIHVVSRIEEGIGYIIQKSESHNP